MLFSELSFKQVTYVCEPHFWQDLSYFPSLLLAQMSRLPMRFKWVFSSSQKQAILFMDAEV